MIVWHSSFVQGALSEDPRFAAFLRQGIAKNGQKKVPRIVDISHTDGNILSKRHS